MELAFFFFFFARRWGGVTLELAWLSSCGRNEFAFQLTILYRGRFRIFFCGHAGEEKWGIFKIQNTAKEERAPK